MTYYAVIGRIPFDDEDSIMFYESDEENPPLAEWFEHDLFEEAGRDDMAEARKEFGGDYAVYITHIVTSQTPLGCI